MPFRRLKQLLIFADGGKAGSGGCRKVTSRHRPARRAIFYPNGADFARDSTEGCGTLYRTADNSKSWGRSPVDASSARLSTPQGPPEGQTLILRRSANFDHVEQKPLPGPHTAGPSRHKPEAISPTSDGKVLTTTYHPQDVIALYSFSRHSTLPAGQHRRNARRSMRSRPRPVPPCALRRKLAGSDRRNNGQEALGKSTLIGHESFELR